MNPMTIEFRPGNRDRAMKPVFAAAAVLATVATFGLLVAGPAALAPASDATVLARHAAPAPIEVAIVPATIQVVGTRAHVARAGQAGFMPTSYRPR